MFTPWIRPFMASAVGASISVSWCTNFFGLGEKKKEVKPNITDQSFVGMFLDKPSRMRLRHALKLEGIEKCDSDVIVLRKNPSAEESAFFAPLCNSNCYARIESIMTNGSSKIGLASVTIEGKNVNEARVEIPSIIVETQAGEDEKILLSLPSRLHSLGISYSSSHERNLKKFRVYDKEKKSNNEPVDLPNENWQGELPPIRIDNIDYNRAHASLKMRNDVLRLSGILCTGSGYDKAKDDCRIMNDLKRFQEEMIKQHEQEEEDDDDEEEEEEDKQPVAEDKTEKKVEEPFISPPCDSLSSLSSIQCSLCKYLKSGPCSGVVGKWEECIHEKKNVDYDECLEFTMEMSKCMEAYTYYDKMNYHPSVFNNYRVLDEEYWQEYQRTNDKK